MWLEMRLKPPFPAYAAETFRNIPNVLEDSGSKDVTTQKVLLPESSQKIRNVSKSLHGTRGWEEG